MIVFNGYISGKAEKRFIDKKRNFLLFIFCQSFILVSPLWFGFTSRSNPIIAVVLYLFLFISILVLILVCSYNKKENSKEKPNKIYTDGQQITAISESNVETKRIDWVKQVIDHGEFYELTFMFGRMSHTFICQKDLLVEGTLKDFEALFKGKLVKKEKTGYGSGSE